MPATTSRIGLNAPRTWFSMLTLVCASKTNNRDSFAVFDGEDCIGHIMRTQKCPKDKPWFWTIFVGGASGIVSDRGYAATREQAIAHFEVEWLFMLKNKEPRNQSGRGSLLIRDKKGTQTIHTTRVVFKM